LNVFTTCSKLSMLQRLAEALVAGLRRELELTPKPGLVDRWDNGSHDDLNYGLMEHSIALLERYFFACVAQLQTGCPLERLREIGIRAEERMLKSFGTNTHRGAIFLGGVLLAAVDACGSRDADTVSNAVADCAHRLFLARLPRHTKGERVRTRYGVGGIVREALDGFPSVFRIGVPALREAGRLGLDDRDALFLAMARLMQTVQDTTALRRCGPGGLAVLRKDGARLESLLLSGADPLPFLVCVNQRYRALRLTMGGIADLLGLCAAWILFEAARYSLGTASSAYSQSAVPPQPRANRGRSPLEAVRTLVNQLLR
jgi:triphosphoribosyl-dephospho-CoA synthase